MTLRKREDVGNLQMKHSVDNSLRKRVWTRYKTDYRMSDTVPAPPNLYLAPISLGSSALNGRVTFSLNNGMYIYNQIIPLYMPIQ